jgi:uncharacterized protein YcfJ
MDVNPYESPQFQGGPQPHRRPRVALWRSATIGAFLGAIVAFHFFHHSFGMGQSNFDDWMLIAGAAVGGYIGYSVPTMRLHPWSR